MSKPKAYVVISYSYAEFKLYAEIIGHTDLFSQILEKHEEIVSGSGRIKDEEICQKIKGLFEILRNAQVSGGLISDWSGEPLFDILIDGGDTFTLVFLKGYEFKEVCFYIIEKALCRVSRSKSLVFRRVKPVL